MQGPINSFEAYSFKVLYAIYRNLKNQRKQLDQIGNYRRILIPTQEYTTLSVNLKRRDRKKLSKIGYQSAISFLKNITKDI